MARLRVSNANDPGKRRRNRYERLSLAPWHRGLGAALGGIAGRDAAEALAAGLAAHMLDDAFAAAGHVLNDLTAGNRRAFICGTDWRSRRPQHERLPGEGQYEQESGQHERILPA